jgi:hypothetical protein
MKKLKLIFTLFLALSAASVAAQSRHFNSATIGMGGGGTAFVDGYHANFLNPANLMINNTGRKPKRTLGLLGGVGLRAGGTLLNQSVYDTYLTQGLVLEGNTRTDMLNAWFGSDVSNTRNVVVGLNLVPFGFSNRGKNTAFSLATRVRAIEEFDVNKGFMELAFYGLDSDHFASPVPVNFSNTLLSYSEISVGFAMALPIPLTGLIEKLPFINGINIYAGAAPKYIVGLQSTELDFTSTLQVTPADQNGPGVITHDFNYSAFVYGDLATQMAAYSNARNGSDPNAKLGDYVDYDGSDVGSLGSGFGLDLGVTAELDVSLPALGFLGKRQVLRVSMSATDLGSISFKENPKEINANSIFTFDGDVGDDSFGDYFDTLSDSLENDVYGGFSANDSPERKYDLPGMYNFGVALTLGKLTATADYGVGFNDFGTNTEISYLTLGAEYRLLNFIPIRVGTRRGGDYSAAYSAGLGLDFRFLELTLGASTVSSDADKGTSLAFAWSGLVIRF